MEITCPRCQSLHEIDPPASARARGPRSLKFRCSHCGHTFTVDPAPAARAEEPSAPPPFPGTPEGAEPISLVQVAGKVWSVPDPAALYRWVLERRIDRDSLVSNHGMRWTRAGDREDLAMFFAASDALSFQERNLRTEIRTDHDEEIIVDAGEAEPGMPVATGPDPFGRRDIDAMVMDFTETRDDTVEQTVSSMGVDEAPIPDVPAGFAHVDPAADRTERVPQAATRVALSSAGGPPAVPAGVTTLTPGIPGAAAPSFSAGGPSPAASARGPAVDAGPSLAPPSTLVPPPAASPAALSPSASQGFFLDGSPVGPGGPSPAGPAPTTTVRRDVFDDDTTGSVPRSGLPVGLIVAALAAVAVVAFVVIGRGGAEKPEGPAPAKVAEVAKPADPPALPAASLPPEAATDADAAQIEAAKAEATAKAEAAAKAEAQARADAQAKAKAEADAKAAAKLARAEATKPTGAGAGAAPAPVAAAGGSPKKLIGQGWKAVEGGDFQKAHSLFDRALQGGTSADALYGRGYANEKLGDAVSASDDYCQALATGSVSVDTSREIEAGLRRVGRSCR